MTKPKDKDKAQVEDQAKMLLDSRAFNRIQILVKIYFLLNNF